MIKLKQCAAFSGLILAFSLLLTNVAFAGVAITYPSESSEIQFTANSFITASLPDVNFSVGVGGFMSASTTLTIHSNNQTGVTVTMTSNSTDTALVNTESQTYKVDTLSASVAKTSFPTNAWGFSLDDTTYNPIEPSDGTASVVLQTDDNSDAKTQTIYFGGKVDASKAAGDYENEILITAVTNYVPTFTCNPSATTIDDAVCMQDINNSVIGSMVAGTQYQLYDSRDEKQYWVAKLEDGNVWMTQNLDLVLSTSTTLTPSDSDVSANWTPSVATQTTQYNGLGGSALWNSGYNITPHSYRPASDANAGTSGAYGSDTKTYDSPVIMINGTTMSSYKSEAECVAGGYTAEQCAHWNVGTYYSWYAATAGTGNANVSTVTNVSDSICPKGWHLPSSTSSGEFQALVTAGSITASTITGSPYYFLRSSYYSGDYGAVNSTGGWGNYWSSTSLSNTTFARILYFISSTVTPSNYGSRYDGMSVRCIATATSSNEASNGNDSTSTNNNATFHTSEAETETDDENTAMMQNADPQGEREYYDEDKSDDSWRFIFSIVLGIVAVAFMMLFFRVMTKSFRDGAVIGDGDDDDDNDDENNYY